MRSISGSKTSAHVAHRMPPSRGSVDHTAQLEGKVGRKLWPSVGSLAHPTLYNGPKHIPNIARQNSTPTGGINEQPAKSEALARDSQHAVA